MWVARPVACRFVGGGLMHSALSSADIKNGHQERQVKSVHHSSAMHRIATVAIGDLIAQAAGVAKRTCPLDLLRAGHELRHLKFLRCCRLSRPRSGPLFACRMGS